MTKKYLVIGDVHGRNHWKYSIEHFYGKADHIIFLGDYVDSHFIPFQEIAKNLEEIVKFKRENMSVCTLLLGNHDVYADYFGGSNNYSGFNPQAAPLYSAIFEENRELFQIAHKYGKHLFTHAGIVKEWWENQLRSHMPVPDINNIDVHINKLLETRNRALYMCSAYRGGMDLYSGPLWCDFNELKDFNLTDYVHHVGHTQSPTLTICSPVGLKRKDSGDLYKYDFIPGGDTIYNYYPLIEINETDRSVGINSL